MYTTIIMLPLIASLASGFFGRKIGIQGSNSIACLCLISSLVLSAMAYLEVGLNNVYIGILISTWIDCESLDVVWKFNYDSLTISMIFPILVISTMVHIYSVGYMETDPHNQRFFSYLSLFTFMMMLLVTANNFLLMFVGWEGVGICSYLLVNFWFTRIAANQSSISALLTNRVGDFFLTLGMFTMLWCFGNLDYSIVFSLTPYINEDIITLIGIFLLIGAMAKSSQIGLHVWLPQAMEGFLKRAFLKFHYMRGHLALSLDPLIKLILGKIQEQRQFAGSCNNCNTISSETTREIFSLNNNLFKLWFIGFTEGDGSFIKNKDGFLEFKITQSSNDAQILFYIKKQLGFGTVRKQDLKSNTHCFRVRDKDNLYKLMCIFNGNMFLSTSKQKFKFWLDAYNKKYKDNIIYINSIFKPSLNDTWLLGFTDAEGCFTCTINENLGTLLKTSLISIRYILSQKGNMEEMNYLANITNGKKHYLLSYEGYNVVVTKGKLYNIVNYFKVNKLKTKKYIDYINWFKIYNLIIYKKHVTNQEFVLISKYKSNLNKQNKQILYNNCLESNFKGYFIIFKNFIIFLLNNKYITYLILLAMFICIFKYSINMSLIYCVDGETEKKLAEAALNAAENTKNINPNVNVNNPNLHLHNPNINIPGSVGTGLGMGGAVTAGIYALAKNKKVAFLPIGAKAASVALGGMLGGGTFVTANYMNTIAQKNANKPENSKNDPFSSANSILEPGDSIYDVMNFLYINYALGILIIYLSCFLLYLYVKHKQSKILISVWICLILTSLFFIYLGYNLLQDIGILTFIEINHLNDLDKSFNINKNEADNLYNFLIANLLIRLSICGSLWLSLALHINTIIVNKNLKFKYIEYILGKYYYYFNKLIRYTSNTNKYWIYVLFTFLILSSSFSTAISYFLIQYIDIISELYYYKS